MGERGAVQAPGTQTQPLAWPRHFPAVWSWLSDFTFLGLFPHLQQRSAQSRPHPDPGRLCPGLRAAGSRGWMENTACEAPNAHCLAWSFVESLPTLDLEDGVTVPPRANVGSAGPIPSVPPAGQQPLGAVSRFKDR